MSTTIYHCVHGIVVVNTRCGFWQLQYTILLFS